MTDARPLRLLVVLPSWIGDAVMATPAVRLLRDERPGAFIGALARPGVDQILAGTDLLDEIHVDRARGIMGPKLVANKLRPRRYDAALLLTNSFSTALITRLAFIPRRVGYDRDARTLLLTDHLTPPRHPDGAWAPIPAVTYYWNAACALLERPDRIVEAPALPDAELELATTPDDEREADRILHDVDGPFAILNPGGNNPAKRWPPDRFASLADHLATEHGLRVLINGAPAEADLVADIAAKATCDPIQLPSRDIAIGSLKATVRRARLMVTNDTGPRHIAAAFRVPVVSLFGPTDHRWTTIPAPGGESILLADPTLPDDQLANDHSDRCRIDRITLERVVTAADALLDAHQGTRSTPPASGS